MYTTLKRVFGFQEFRPNQEEIVKQILGLRDVFAVMPTGGGKSLCYQLPARMMEGTTVVISPLISLMKDQVDAALENGIEAAFVNSTLTPQEMSDVFRKVKNNALELLYVAPERFAMLIVSLLSVGPLMMIYELAAHPGIVSVTSLEKSESPAKLL